MKAKKYPITKQLIKDILASTPKKEGKLYVVDFKTRAYKVETREVLIQSNNNNWNATKLLRGIEGDDYEVKLQLVVSETKAS